MSSELLPLAALWRYTSKAGKTYYTGRLGELKVLMFEIKSDNPKAPAYKLYLGEFSQSEERAWQEDDQPPKPERHNVVVDDVPF